MKRRKKLISDSEKDLKKINKNLIIFFEKYGDEIPEKDLLEINNAWSKIHNWISSG